MVIYKYQITGSDCEIEMPEGSNVLTAHEQNGRICVWAEVDTSKPLEKRRFVTVGTGYESPADGTYIGTAFIYAYVMHVYEIKK